MTDRKPWPKVLANWLLNDFTGLCRKYGTTPPESGIPPQDFSFIIRLHWLGVLSREEVRTILNNRLKTLHNPTTAE